MGYVIVALFILAWILSLAVWKLGRLEQRYAVDAAPQIKSAINMTSPSASNR